MSKILLWDYEIPLTPFQLILIAAAIIALAGPWIVRAMFGIPAARIAAGVILALLLAGCAFLFLNGSDGHGAALLGFVILAAITFVAAISGYFAAR